MSGQMLPMPAQVRVTVDWGSIRVWPDPAEVAEGGTVEWEFDLQTTLPSLTLEIYFSGNSPTTWSTKQINVRSSSGGPAARITATVNDPGEYKYGVKATQMGTHQVIADDDPYLIVRPR
jgi:hypothetical protein